MHTPPANLSFSGELLAKILRNAASFAERLRDELRVALRVLRPITHAAGRIDPDDPVRAHAEFAQLARDAAGLEHLAHEILPLLRAAHGRAAAGGLPHGRNDRADDEAETGNLVSQALQIIIANIDADMWVEEKEVHAIELHTVHRGVGGEKQHGIQINTWLSAGTALADQPRPHCVVKFWVRVHVFNS